MNANELYYDFNGSGHLIGCSLRGCCLVSFLFILFFWHSDPLLGSWMVLPDIGYVSISI